MNTDQKNHLMNRRSFIKYCGVAGAVNLMIVGVGSVVKSGGLSRKDVINKTAIPIPRTVTRAPNPSHNQGMGSRLF